MTYPLDEPTTEDLNPDLAATGPRDVHGEARADAPAPGSVPVHRPGASGASAREAVRSAQSDRASQAACVTPLRLPCVDRAAARVTRTLCDTRVEAHLHAALGLSDWRAGLTDARSFYMDDAQFADPGLIELSIAASETGRSGDTRIDLSVAVDLRAWPALAITAWPDRDSQTLSASRPPADHALREAVAGVVLAPLFERLRRVGFSDPRVTDVRRRRMDDAGLSSANAVNPPAPVVALSFTLDDKPYRVALTADPALYGVLDRLARQAAARALQDAAAQLVIPGSLILGVKRLAVSTLNALEPGDVLLRAAFPSLDATLVVASNDSPAPHARPRAIAAWGVAGLTRVCAAVEIDGQSLVIVKEPNMSEELDPASADAGLAIDDPADPIRIDELELPVQFEIDTVALPLAQLSALGPGYVLELPVPVADAQLRLVAHGQTIGYGELVTVGEHLGIRIIRMAHRHGPIQ